MKILKEFIPLILNGDKAYEFRNSDEHFDKVYEIDGNYYYLEIFKYLPKKELLLAFGSYDTLFGDTGHDDMHAFSLIKDKYGSGFQITKQEFEWLYKNWNSYFGEYIYIGAWQKLTIDKLEIIDKKIKGRKNG